MGIPGSLQKFVTSDHQLRDDTALRNKKLNPKLVSTSSVTIQHQQKVEHVTIQRFPTKVEPKTLENDSMTMQHQQKVEPKTFTNQLRDDTVCRNKKVEPKTFINQLRYDIASTKS